MKLVFVYNAKSGFLSAALDAIRRLVSPRTYPCRLCALTYGALGERDLWRRYRRRSALEIEFLHKDEFEEAYGRRFPYPVILCDDGGRLTRLFSKERLEEMDTVEELIDALDALEEAVPEEGVTSCRAAAEVVAGAV